MPFGATNSGHELEVVIGNEVMKEAINVSQTPSGGWNRSTMPGLKGSHSLLIMALGEKGEQPLYGRTIYVVISLTWIVNKLSHISHFLF